MASFERQVYPETDFTVIKIIGEIKAGEILDWAEKSGHKDRTRLVLWDLTESSWSKIPSELLKKNLGLAQKKFAKPGDRTAFVLGNDLDYGLGRVVENQIESEDTPAEYRPFLSIDAARAWLFDLEGSH